MKRFNMQITMKIDDIAVELKIDVKMLKFQIDFKLKWHFHMKIIKIKMITQCMILFKIMIFTWKPFFIKMKQIYLMMIHLIMIYISTRVAVGLDRKQFLASDPIFKKNWIRSDPTKKFKIWFDLIRFNSIKLAYCLIELKRIGFEKKNYFRFHYQIGISTKNASVGVKPTDFRRTSAPTRPP